MAQDTISHFSHPGHELVKRHYVGPYRCDMCWENLTGPAYGCVAGCDFAIHDSCAAHPQTLISSSAHPPHSLVLLQTRPDMAYTCDVCAGRCATGAFLYRCPPCGFDRHPRCGRLPQAVRSAHHPAHDLALVVADGSCVACHLGAGRGWYYRCSACNVDLHVLCASSGGGEGSNAGARHEGYSLGLMANLIGARLLQQGSQTALDLVSPPDPDERTRRRNYFYI